MIPTELRERRYFDLMPRYRQVVEIIKREIANGAQPHEALPSEPAMMEAYHTSRATIRQALDVLLSEHLIYRRPGKGTFINEPPERCPCCGQVLPAGTQSKKSEQTVER